MISPARRRKPQARSVGELTIVHLAAPGGFGGLERVVAGLTSALVSRARRTALMLVLDERSEIPSWVAAPRALGVEIIALRPGDRAYGRERQAVRAALGELGADLLHTHGYRPDVVDAGVAKALGLPIVSTVHGFTRRGLKGRAFEWIQIRSLRRFDAVIAVSRPLVAELGQRGVPRDRLHLIPNGIVRNATPALERMVARSALGSSHEGPLVGWVGRVSREKALDVMIHGFAQMPLPEARLLVVGDGPELQQCKLLAESLGVAPRVMFAGAIADAAPIMSAFDVLALSSHTEGTPMVLLEAALAGVPIVSTRVGGVPDLIGDDGGLLVPPNDPTALAAALSMSLRDRPSALRAAAIVGARLEAQDREADWVTAHSVLYERLCRTAR